MKSTDTKKSLNLCTKNSLIRLHDDYNPAALSYRPNQLLNEFAY